LDERHEIFHAHSYSISKDTFGISGKLIQSCRYLLMFLIPFAIVDNLCTYLFVYRPILKDRILICDRYFYDKVARAMFYGVCPLWLARIWLNLLPKPDLVFFLTEPHVKKEEITDYDKWIKVYKEIEYELS
jgi:thymidylate kinase